MGRPGEQLGLGQALLWMGSCTSVCLNACFRWEQDTRAKPFIGTGEGTSLEPAQDMKSLQDDRDVLLWIELSHARPAPCGKPGPPGLALVKANRQRSIQ